MPRRGREIAQAGGLLRHARTTRYATIFCVFSSVHGIQIGFVEVRSIEISEIGLVCGIRFRKSLFVLYDWNWFSGL